MLRANTEAPSGIAARAGLRWTRSLQVPNVSDGSISTELGGSRHVRFPTDSDRIADIPDWQLRAINRCEQSQHSGLGPWSANIGERAYLARPLAALNQEQGARIADARVLTRHGECERALTLALGSIAA
jgi:hypothetical protein